MQMMSCYESKVPGSEGSGVIKIAMAYCVDILVGHRRGMACMSRGFLCTTSHTIL